MCGPAHPSRCCHSTTSSTRQQADAIRDSLKSLFSEAVLPDNPYYYLASALGAYVDQNALWAENDVSIITAIDNEGGGLDVADAANKLCKLAASSCSVVLGLPHVLRTVSKEGQGPAGLPLPPQLWQLIVRHTHLGSCCLLSWRLRVQAPGSCMTC